MAIAPGFKEFLCLSTLFPNNLVIVRLKGFAIGKARVIYRMLPTGKWIVVPKFRAAAKSIPANALFTVVRSPIAGQSKNIPSAKLKNSALASQHKGTAYASVLKGKLWRGTARIIVNW